MTKIYFARHGLSEMNLIGLFSGHSETPLTDKGREQALQAGQKAKADKLKFDAIISSPLSRAQETVEIIASQIGFDQSDIKTHRLLKERHFGKLEGAPYISTKELHRQDPYSLDQIPGIETLAELHERAIEFLNWLEEQGFESVLLVSHGAIGRAIRRVVEGKQLHDPVDRFENGVIYQLT